MSAAIEIGGAQFELRDLGRNDRAALIGLHREVFGEGASDGWYVWKYVQGHGLGSGLWHDGRLVAHCGGVPRALWQEGERRTGIQIGDVMVAPQWRGVLTRRGPFFHVSQKFYDGHVGSEHAVAFGFPSERHLRLAVKTQLLWDGGPVHSLSWMTAHAPAPGWAWRWEPLDAGSPAFDSAIASAWSNMQAECGRFVVGERNADYVRWRFFRRPGRHHAAFALRRAWSRAVRGVAILDLAQPTAHWLDWIGRPSDMPLACTCCRAQAHAAGAQYLTAWATPAVAQSLAPSGILHSEVTAWLGIPRRSQLAEADVGRLAWWLMGGDTDFL
ncbi:GNAT family N-acetyltransferase [Ramlibacter albus]|uniref:GNAT family N-acetyltransferase n=1 Tax=Ramlibacter albus TaxID=2079448 RepID=A0A923M6I9_9BURK|nr:GNAT family N-acetyltransferase [Ramlibacter albus]MBC5764748.1 GNAT family N-acetyltransferase [Ramlibacter albus]